MGKGSCPTERGNWGVEWRGGVYITCTSALDVYRKVLILEKERNRAEELVFMQLFLGFPINAQALWGGEGPRSNAEQSGKKKKKKTTLHS